MVRGDWEDFLQCHGTRSAKFCQGVRARSAFHPRRSPSVAMPLPPAVQPHPAHVALLASCSAAAEMIGKNQANTRSRHRACPPPAHAIARPVPKRVERERQAAHQERCPAADSGSRTGSAWSRRPTGRGCAIEHRERQRVGPPRARYPPTGTSRSAGSPATSRAGCRSATCRAGRRRPARTGTRSSASRSPIGTRRCGRGASLTTLSCSLSI